MIEVKNVTKTFRLDSKDFKALDQVSFSVSRGEIFGIIGLSGAGKSTMVRSINRLETPDRGEILIDGKDILGLSDQELLQERKDISMIFQSFNLFSQKTVFKNIAYPMEVSNFSKEEISKRVDFLLEFVGLSDKKNEYPDNLSGGQKQRVAIARALATKPKILLSDEATSALDPQNTKIILDLIKRAVKEFDLTVIMITHQMEVAKDICDRIAVMENGKIIEENTVEELFKNPKHPVTKSFIENVQSEKASKQVLSNGKGYLYRLTFDEKIADKPIVSQVIKKTGIDINILSGNINKLSNTSVGHLNIELIGNENMVKESLKLFQDSQVGVEEIR